MIDQMTQFASYPVPVIEAKELAFFYQEDTWIFKNISLSIGKAKIFSILGPNGCGKTTFLKIILGLLKPRAGSLEKKGHIAFVPQLFHVAFAYSALDMVLMGRAKAIGLFSKPTNMDIELAMNALEHLKIKHLANKPFYELSGGQRQLVMMARALVAEADILVLDEPTSALDLGNQNMLLQWIETLSKEKGLTVVFTTHLPHHALIVADEVLLMTDSENYYFGTADEVLNEDNLSKMYGIPLKRIQFEHGGHLIRSLVPILKTATLKNF